MGLLICWIFNKMGWHGGEVFLGREFVAKVTWPHSLQPCV